MFEGCVGNYLGHAEGYYIVEEFRRSVGNQACNFNFQEQ